MSPCDVVKTIFGYARMIFAITRFGPSAITDISNADLTDLSSYKLKKIKPTKGSNHSIILFGLLHNKVPELVNTDNVDIFDSEYEGEVTGDYLLITDDGLFDALNDVELNYILSSYSGLIVQLGAMNEFTAWGTTLLQEKRFFSTPFSVSVSTVAPLPVNYYPINALSGFYPAYLASQYDFKDSALLDKITKGNLFGTHLSILKTERAIYREFGKLKFICGAVLGTVAMKYKDAKGAIKESYVNFKIVGERMLMYGVTDFYPELGNDLTRTVWKELITDVCLNEIENRIKKPMTHLNIPNFLVGWMQYLDTNTESSTFSAKLMNLCDKYGWERPNIDGTVGVFMSLFPYAYVSFADRLKPEFQTLWNDALKYAEKYGLSVEQSDFGFEKLYDISTKAVTKYILPDTLYGNSNVNRKMSGTVIKGKKTIKDSEPEVNVPSVEGANLSMMEVFMSKKDKNKPDLESANLPKIKDDVDSKPILVQKEADIKTEEKFDWKDMSLFKDPTITLTLEECQNARIELMPKHLAQKFRSGEYDFKKTYTQWIKDVNAIYERLPWDFFLYFKQKKGNGLRAEALKKCLTGNNSQKNKIVTSITSAYHEKLALISPTENVIPANVSLNDLEKITGVTTKPEPLTEQTVESLIKENAESTAAISNEIDVANDVVDSKKPEQKESETMDINIKSSEVPSLEKDFADSSQKLDRDLKNIASKMAKKEFPKYKMTPTAVVINDNDVSYDIMNVNLLGEGDIVINHDDLSKLQTSVTMLLKWYNDKNTEDVQSTLCTSCDEYKKLNSELALSHSNAEQTVADLRQANDKLSNDCLAFETKLAELTTSMSECKKELEKKTNDYTTLLGDFETARDQADRVPDLILQLDSVKAELEVIKNDLEMCENTTQQALEDLKKMQEELTKIQEERTDLLEKNTNLLNEKETHNKDKVASDEKIALYEQEISQLRIIIENKDKQYDELQETIPSRVDNAVANAIEEKNTYIQKLENGQCHRCIELQVQLDDLQKDSDKEDIITPSLLSLPEDDSIIPELRAEIAALKVKLEDAEFVSASEDNCVSKIKPGKEINLATYDDDLRDTYVKYVTLKPKNALEARARYLRMQKVQAHGTNVDANATLYYRNQPVCQSALTDGNYITLDIECPCKRDHSVREWMKLGYVPVLGMISWEARICSCYVVPSKLENVEKFISLSSGIAVPDVELLNQLLG